MTSQGQGSTCHERRLLIFMSMPSQQHLPFFMDMLVFMHMPFFPQQLAAIAGDAAMTKRGLFVTIATTNRFRDLNRNLRGSNSLQETETGFGFIWIF